MRSNVGCPWFGVVHTNVLTSLSLASFPDTFMVADPPTHISVYPFSTSLPFAVMDSSGNGMALALMESICIHPFSATTTR